LELEEFRVLEQEILGDSSQQKLPPFTEASRAAPELLTTSTADETAAPPAVGLATSTCNSFLEFGGELQAHDPEGSGNDAGDDDPEPHFEDNIEWMDTEFSLTHLPQNVPQLQQQAASIQKQQRMQQPQVQQLHQSNQQERQLADDGSPHTMLAQQPFLRSLFTASCGASAAATVQGTSQSRNRAAAAGAAAAAGYDRPQHPVSAGLEEGRGSPEGPHHSGSAASADEDSDEQLVAVSVMQVKSWQRLEAAESALQQERSNLRKMRVELEKAANRLQQEQQSWERQRVSGSHDTKRWTCQPANQPWTPLAPTGSARPLVVHVLVVCLSCGFKSVEWGCAGGVWGS
jgi:FtsZ-binding cell division protein ZapB